MRSPDSCAAVAELVDATDSKSVSGDRVGVRFPSAAPFFLKNVIYNGLFSAPLLLCSTSTWKMRSF